jgi:phosphonate transport system substrate-binding protein
VEQLRGRRLLVLRAPNMCVAPAWLSNLLRPQEPAGMERFFASVAHEAKPARVILPVFFGQADACLTTRRSFSIMSELNPQIARRLRPLLVSPEIVSTLYAFRKNYSGPNRERLTQALADLSKSASGRQVLTMYQLDGLIERDISCLDSSLAILAEADRPAGRKPGAGIEAKGAPAKGAQQ